MWQLYPLLHSASPPSTLLPLTCTSPLPAIRSLLDPIGQSPCKPLCFETRFPCRVLCALTQLLFLPVLWCCFVRLVCLLCGRFWDLASLIAPRSVPAFRLQLTEYLLQWLGVHMFCSIKINTEPVRLLEGFSAMIQSVWNVCIAVDEMCRLLIDSCAKLSLTVGDPSLSPHRIYSFWRMEI